MIERYKLQIDLRFFNYFYIIILYYTLEFTLESTLKEIH